MRGVHHRIADDLGHADAEAPLFMEQLDLDLERGLAAYLKRQADFARYVEEQGAE